MSFGKSKQKSNSAPLVAEDLTKYYDELNSLSGGKLGDFAQSGTQPVDYQGLSAEQIQALGGLGATRKNELDVQRERTAEEIAADPSYGVAQKQRARQLSDQDYSARTDAIAKETEAAITGLASEESLRKYQAAAANAGLSAKDMQLLAQIFFGGKGQVTTSKGGNVQASLFG